ncbi:MAG TPA: hypothetical protein VGS08_05795 [Candidatus Saccharimonadales bacterium]|nr:hypothetical protein [Candidatus Saccharimonadales bacterium]
MSIMRARPLSPEQTIDILSGPRVVPADVTDRVEAMLNEGIPIVDVDRFSEFVTSLMVETPSDPNQAIAENYQSIVTLGSCSLEMAWQQAGDIHIPRPRRLCEHNQSVLNTYDRVFAATFTDPRDRLIKPMLSLQDGGKAHGVAVALLADPNNPRPNRNQAIHNNRVAANVLAPVPADVLSVDEKKVIKLLVQQTALGKALRKHHEKGVPLDEAVAEAEEELNRLRKQCPPAYKDRFDVYSVVGFLVDAGAHTRRALYTDAATGEVRPDVLPENRFKPDGSETMMTLDRLFSEVPDNMGKLKLHHPNHLAVMHRLFPGQTDYYE